MLFDGVTVATLFRDVVVQRSGHGCGVSCKRAFSYPGGQKMLALIIPVLVVEACDGGFLDGW